MKANIWFLLIGILLSALSGYIMSDLQAWEYVVGILCFVGGVVFMKISNIFNVQYWQNRRKKQFGVES